MKKVLVIGGGPAGLYFAISVKLREPQTKITVIERKGRRHLWLGGRFIG